MCVQRKGLVRTQQGGSHVQAKDRGFNRNQTCQYLYLGLRASRAVGSQSLWFGSPGKLAHRTHSHAMSVSPASGQVVPPISEGGWVAGPRSL